MVRVRSLTGQRACYPFLAVLACGWNYPDPVERRRGPSGVTLDTIGSVGDLFRSFPTLKQNSSGPEAQPDVMVAAIGNDRLARPAIGSAGGSRVMPGASLSEYRVKGGHEGHLLGRTNAGYFETRPRRPRSGA